MAATGAATSTSARDRWTGLSAFVAAKTPAVNSSESPGRKKPSNSPVSAKMISRMPSSPNVSTRDRASSQLTARTASARCTLPGYRAPLDGDLGASGCLLYTSDAADEEDSVDLGGRRIIKKKKKIKK